MASHPLVRAYRWVLIAFLPFALLFGAAVDPTLSDGSRAALLIVVAVVWVLSGWKILRAVWGRLRFARRLRANVRSLREQDGHGASHRPAAQSRLKVVHSSNLPHSRALHIKTPTVPGRPAGWRLFRAFIIGLLLVAGSIVILVTLGEPWGPLTGWLPFVALYVGGRLCKRARRYGIPSAAEVCATDTRPKVLMLRPFIDEEVSPDSDTAFAADDRKTLTHLATEYFSRVGPVVALLSPIETLPRFGPYPVDALAEGEDWHDRVRVLSREASLVVACVGRTPGIVDELVLLADESAFGKTRLLFPPVGHEELIERWDFFKKLVNRVPALEPLLAVDYRLLRAAYFDLHGDLVAIWSERPTRKAYEQAIQALVEAPRASPRVQTIKEGAP
jgi:hypothetical protein